MLRQLPLKAVYRTDTDNLLREFYIPVLAQSVRYDRAVGFFSTAMLSYAAQGLSALIAKRGKIRLIIGGELLAEEAEAITRGLDLRVASDRFVLQFVKTVDEISDDLVNYRLQTLAWLIAAGLLEVKVALRRRGMYHEKLGILTDEAGDRVVFQGSANETVHALAPDFNFESINVFPSWRTELTAHASPYIEGFERLWENRARDTVVLGFPEAARERLIRVASDVLRVPSAEIEVELWSRLLATRVADDPIQPRGPTFPVSLHGEEYRLLDHQKSALDAWKGRSFQGILELATGAGKTVTALHAAVSIFRASGRLFLVVAVPYQNLADQWATEAQAFSIAALRCYGAREEWQAELTSLIDMFAARTINWVCVVVVNRTLTADSFQGLLRRVEGATLMFVGDECHHHAAPSFAAALPQAAAYRLGLSATPHSSFRAPAESEVAAYYGSVCARYSLADALAQGVLTPYDYFIETVHLTDSEADDYRDLSHRISRLAAVEAFSDEPELVGGKLKTLLFARARLLGGAANKLRRLEELLARTQPQPYTLVYCGDGSVEDESSADQLLRQVESVAQTMYRYGWKVGVFTSRESRRTRQQMLDNFRLGSIDALVAIRCLDEGIDVPACRSAFVLASSRNPRQFIQRRGRILRKAPNKTSARIVDIMALSPPQHSETLELERRLAAAELARVAEFARLSQTAGATYATLRPLLEAYDLAHWLV